MGSFLMSLVEGVAAIYILIIIARILMAWFKQDIIEKYYSFFRIVIALTDPLFILIRRYIPASVGRMDFSPLIAIVVVLVVKGIIILIIRALFYSSPVL